MRDGKLEVGKEIGIRLWTPDDYPFVFSSWMHQIRRVPPFRDFDNDEFGNHRSRIVEPIAYGLGVLVAHDLQRPNVLLGFICYKRPDTLHFVYVKDGSGFRRMGIGTALMRRAFGDALGRTTLYATHMSGCAKHDKRLRSILSERWGLKYDPYRTEIVSG